MSFPTYHYFCDQLRSQILHYRRAIPVEKRVAIILRFLANPGEYRTIAHLFGVARCTVGVIVKQVCTAIDNVLQKQYILLLQCSTKAVYTCTLACHYCSSLINYCYKHWSRNDISDYEEYLEKGKDENFGGLIDCFQKPEVTSSGA